MKRLYEEIGGEAVLKQIVTSFINRIYDDSIIGFFFIGVDKEVLIQREVEFASLHLGGEHEYSGRPIGPVHRRFAINRGHFHRRLWIIEETLREYKLSEEIIFHWIEQNKALEESITNRKQCNE